MSNVGPAFDCFHGEDAVRDNQAQAPRAAVKSTRTPGAVPRVSRLPRLLCPSPVVILASAAGTTCSLALGIDDRCLAGSVWRSPRSGGGAMARYRVDNRFLSE